MIENRNLSKLDDLLVSVDQGLRTVFGRPLTTGRSNPARIMAEGELDDAQAGVSRGLMRVNHAGEVAAQGLYQGQAVTARLPHVRRTMEQAAQEENDHLAWCEDRVRELGGRPSLLGPFWYAGSFMIGALAGATGDKWSLGFVAETERQVGDHLGDHLYRLPADDHRSRAIVEQMREDEARHATAAVQSGGAPLPRVVRRLMGLGSKVMTTLAYRI